MVEIIADPDQEKTVFFVNSSILHYAECCVVTGEIYDIEIEGCSGEWKEKWRKYTSRYAQAIHEIDPPALADERALHACIVESMRAEYGL